MRLCMLLLLATLLTSFAFAQEEVDLAVGFPSTTLGYIGISEDMVSYQSEFTGVLDGFNDQLMMPSIGQILREQLYLEMPDEDADNLITGIKRGAIGLLDIGLKGPKVQLVIEHKDLSVLVAALTKSHKDNPDVVTEIEDYYGTDVFEFNMPLGSSVITKNVQTWLVDRQLYFNAGEEFYIAVIENKYLVLSTSESAVKDGIDFLLYPEDAEGTLLSNRRYKDAVNEFENADAMLFVNVSSVISTLERVSGDNGSNPMLDNISQRILQLVFRWSRGMSEPETLEFLTSLMQYEQFKSFAAVVDYNEKDNTFIFDSAIEFHNAPAWFELLRIEPSDWVFDEFIPDDSVLAVSSTAGDYDKLYKGIRELFVDRAKNAGRDALVEGLELAEQELTNDKSGVSEILKRFGKGAAVVVMPIKNNRNMDTVGIFALSDIEEAEEYFYAKLMATKIGDALRNSGEEIKSAQIEIYHDVEIHLSVDNDGFAFVPDGKQGLFVKGTVGGIKRIIDAKKSGNNLSNMKAWRQAKNLTWDKVGASMYLNVGSAVELISQSNSRGRFRFMGGGMVFFGKSFKPASERDATRQDDNPYPKIADTCRRTVLVAAARSTETGIKLRISNAGLPTREKVRGMLEHFKKVALNRLVRNDLVDICKEARMYYSIKSTAAENVKELVAAGRIDENVAHDDYDTDGKREYLFAKQVKDPDIRQAILLAYQEKAGLRGHHLAVLWNGDVLELTDEQLKQALEAAENGERVDDKDWYKETVPPLIDSYRDRDEEAELQIVRRKPVPKAVIVLIDEEGTEEKVEVDEKEILGEVEGILDSLDEENTKKDEVK